MANSKKKAAPKKKSPLIAELKPVRNTLCVYLFLKQDIMAKELSTVLKEWSEVTELWPELNLMEIELPGDSMFFQDATQLLFDSEDKEFLVANQVGRVYEIQYDDRDSAQARRIFSGILDVYEGFIGNDTDDFEPVIFKENL